MENPARPDRPSTESPTPLPRENVLQDDGEHMLLSTRGVEGSTSDGLLLRRCAFSIKAPLGYEFVGQYRQLSDGFWHATIRSRPRSDGSQGPPQTGMYVTEIDALVNLWANRRHRDLATRF